MKDSEDIIRHVFEHYDLGKLKKFEAVKGGYINNNFKVFTDTGIYFLRGFSNVKDAKKINFLNKFLNKLKEKHFPVPRPFLNKEGTYYVSSDGSFYSVYEFIEGTTYNFSQTHLLEAARTLARFHKAVEAIEVEDYKTLSFDPSFFIELYEDEKFLVKNKLETDFEDKSFLINSLNKYKFNIGLLEKEYASLPKRNDLKIVHGDFWFGQLIFQGDEVVALVDFDEIKKGLFEFDLVKGLRSFTRYKDEPGYDFKNMKLFLEEYKKIQPNIKLSKVEIIFYLRYSLLSILKFHIYSAVEKSFTEERKHLIDYHIKELKWVKSDEDKIVDVFFDVFKNN